MEDTESKSVPSVSNDGRNTSLIAENSDKTIGSQDNWRSRPRLRGPWKNPEMWVHDGIAEIRVVQKEHAIDQFVKIDVEDLDKLKQPIRINNEYAYNTGVNKPVAHAILGVEKDPTGARVVDHINGDHLDNRKCNLRVVSGRGNTRNKGHYSLNNTGIIGLSETSYINKQNGRLYRRFVATLTDPRFPIDPKTEKGKRYTRSVSFGGHRSKSVARAIALAWLEKKKKEVGYDVIT